MKCYRKALVLGSVTLMLAAGVSLAGGDQNRKSHRTRANAAMEQNQNSKRASDATSRARLRDGSCTDSEASGGGGGIRQRLRDGSCLE